MKYVEAIHVAIEWDSRRRMARTSKDMDDRWIFFFKAGIRRHSYERKAWELWWWNPYVNLRVLGLFVGAGLCIADEPKVAPPRRCLTCAHFEYEHGVDGKLCEHDQYRCVMKCQEFKPAAT